MTQESIPLMLLACLAPIKVTATVLGTGRLKATGQPTSAQLQTLQLQEKLYDFSRSFSVNKERNYSGNRSKLYIFTHFYGKF